MIRAIRAFFENNIAPSPARRNLLSVELATAAILVEVVRSDAETTEVERQVVLTAVREKFGLSPGQAEELFTLAEAEVRQATDTFQFTSLINRHFTPEQKMRVMEFIWRVVLADQVISAHERHLVRRLADLLHLTPGQVIAAQERAKSSCP